MMLCKTLPKEDLEMFVRLSKGWVAQEKFDGDRMQMHYKDGKLQFLNRRGSDVTFRYPEFKDFKAPMDFIVDGEMCVLDDTGTSRFNEGIAFRSHCQSPEKIEAAAKEFPATYVIFDIVSLDGNSQRNSILADRLELLRDTFNTVVHPSILIAETNENVLECWEEVIKRGGEGVILKNLGSLYKDNKRSPNWLKVKDIREADVLFTKYEVHNMGITVESEDGIRVTVNGQQSQEVKGMIDAKKQALITIRHLGDKTANDRFRQPTFMKLVEVENGESV